MAVETSDVVVVGTSKPSVHDTSKTNAPNPSPGVDPASLFSVPGDTAPSRETQLLDVIKGVMSTDGMNVKTVLEDKHIVAIARGLIFAERYDSTLMRNLVQILMEVRVSKGGRGRRDLISAIKSSLSGGDEVSGDESSVANKRRLFGG